MRSLLLVAALTLLMTTPLRAADEQTVIAAARQRIETTDARGSGHLVRIDANGKRVSNAINIKAHWFPGVLRVLLEITPARSAGEGVGADARSSVLLEMRPKGQTTIRVFHPHGTMPAVLPFAKWDEGVFGSDFSYEDFLEPEYFWQSQSVVKTAKFGARTCDVLKSEAGASDRSHYREVQTWIDQAIAYPVYVEKTLKEGSAVKEFTSLGLSQSGGVWAARQVEVKLRGRPGSTLLIIDRGSARANLSEKDFNPAQISKFEDH